MLRPKNLEFLDPSLFLTLTSNPSANYISLPSIYIQTPVLTAPVATTVCHLAPFLAWVTAGASSLVSLLPSQLLFTALSSQQSAVIAVPLEFQSGPLTPLLRRLQGLGISLRGKVTAKVTLCLLRSHFIEEAFPVI